MSTAGLAEARREATFDVICAGEAIWRSASVRGARVEARASSAGLVDVAVRLARQQLRVAVATVLPDDRRGRALWTEMAGSSIDVGAVTLAARAPGIVVVDAAGGELDVLAEQPGASRELEIPPHWSSEVLLLSGVSPLTSRAAALCRAARRARRAGTIVVLDATGSLLQWAGRDARTLAMVIREAHVVRCSVMDLAILGMDAVDVRRAMRDDATLLFADDDGVTASGPFGVVRVHRASAARAGGDAWSDACVAAVCLDLARPPRATESVAARWDRVLRSA